MWEHFTRRKDAARCNLCGKEYKFFNSTSNLSKHLRTSHSDVWKDAGPDKASTKPITSWVISKGNTHSCSSSKAKAITELIVDWLSTSGRPLSIVNDPGFKGILGFLEPDYQVPSRTHVASLIKKRHQNGKQELGGLLRAAPAVALTTDAWTSRATQSYATYTAPGLEKSGRLVAICDQKIFLATRSQAAVVNLATNFSTKGPVWRPQFCARFHVRTNGTVRRPENERQVSENEIKISKTFLVIRVTLPWHTLTRPPAPSPPPPIRVR